MKRVFPSALLSPVLLLLLFATLLTAGEAHAGLPAGDPPTSAARDNGPTTGTPTPTRTPTPACVAQGTPGPWAVMADYPEPIAGLAVASDGTNVYGFGGRNSGRLNTAYKYNYAANSWTAIPTIPAGLGIGLRAEYGRNGKIYVMGGTAESPSANRIYDIASNTWSLGASVPMSVTDHNLGYWNGKIYVISQSGAFAYDIASDMWSTLAPVPSGEYGRAAAVINGKIYVANGNNTNNLYIYDIGTDTWSQGPPSPLASSYPAGAAIGGKFYMIGGGNEGTAYPYTYLYDPATNSWSEGPQLGIAYNSGGAAVINTPGGETVITVGGYFGFWTPSVEASTAPFVPCTTVTVTPTRTPTPTCVAQGTPGPWTARANYPEPISGLSVASDGTDVYGFTGRAVSRINRAYKYNYAANSWTAIPTIPAGLGTGSKAEYGHNGKIYVIGGTTEAPTANRIYDIASNTWSLGAPVPAIVGDHGLAYWDGKMYVIGGGYYGQGSSAVFAYDIASDTWSTRAPLPQSEADMATAAINGKIYVANGNTSSGVTNTLYIYDISTDTWSQGPPSPLPSAYAAGTAIGGKLYMIGGGNGRTSTYLYDPVTNIWSAGPDLYRADNYGGAATINTPGGETAIVVGGYGAGNWIADVEASTLPIVPCTTPTSTPTGTPVASPSRSPVGSPPVITGTPTRTRTVTNTPVLTSTDTATPCTMPFTDVSPGDYFYTAVRYLYCNGVVSGYADNTFRPYNTTTRGQVCKIVVLAEGFTIYTPPSPTFVDVPADHPFYQYVETAYHQGIVSGYTCGAICLEFRPSANVTRAQLCKVTVLAESWPTYTPPTPTFMDVQTNHPFYGYIETAYYHNIISGYTCGATCLEFRPDGSATRGQICKIVYNAISGP